MIKNIIRDFFSKFLRTPLSNNDKNFEEIFYKLNQNLSTENSFINKIISELTDDMIIYKKGEGPEVVFKENNQIIPRKGAILMLKYFIAKRLELTMAALGDFTHDRILDIGTTSGLFLRYLEKKEMGLNISEKAVENTKKHGVACVCASADDLPFENNSFDHILCFQTIEHLENPIKALKEAARVSKKRIIITIPNVDKTRICPFETPDRPSYRWHCFEFCDADFRKILDRIGLTVIRSELIRSHGQPKTLHQKLFISLWSNHTWFKGFRFYVLEKKRGRQ